MMVMFELVLKNMPIFSKIKDLQKHLPGLWHGKSGFKFLIVSNFEALFKIMQMKKGIGPWGLALTHISLASFLWDIGKQYSPRCDAAERGVPSGAILFAKRNIIEKWNKNS